MALFISHGRSLVLPFRGVSFQGFLGLMVWLSIAVRFVLFSGSCFFRRAVFRFGRPVSWSRCAAC